MRPAIRSHDLSADSDLVARIANGDIASLGSLFDRYQADVRRLAARLGVPPADLDDLVQQTFLELLRAARRFDRSRPVRTWLLGIAVIMVRRHRRRLARWADRLAAWTRESASTSATTEADAIDTEVGVRRALRAIDRLSHKKREVFVMVTLENCSGPEAARSLGIPLATVWTRLHHARRELRRVLEDGAEGEHK